MRQNLLVLCLGIVCLVALLVDVRQLVAEATTMDD